MKKISTFILALILFATKVYAYGYDLSVTSNTVSVGNSISLNIRVTDAAGKFNITSSNPGVISVSSSSAWIDNTTQSLTLRANREGTATISVSASDVTSYGGANISGTKSVTITVRSSSAPKPSGNGGYTAPKSSNNFLSSLTVDNYKINEPFDKENLEYSLTVPADTEKIKINAQLADSTATLTGVGEIKVQTGVNNLEIIVTAANGSKRTYKLNVTVEEAKPIKVKINNKEYTVVRKRKELPEISEYYEEKEITINGETIEGYYNKKLGYTLVGLKDKKGKTDYYIYKNNKYTLYKEYSFNGTILQILDKSLKKGYKKTSFIYDDDKISSYQEVKLNIIKNSYALDNNDIIGNQFYLFYAKNIETGKTSLYQYDALEKTVQRYNLEVLNMYKNNTNTYYTWLIIGGIIILTLIITLITFIVVKNNKEKKEKKSLKKKK